MYRRLKVKNKLLGIAVRLRSNGFSKRIQWYNEPFHCFLKNGVPRKTKRPKRFAFLVDSHSVTYRFLNGTNFALLAAIGIAPHPKITI